MFLDEEIEEIPVLVRGERVFTTPYILLGRSHRPDSDRVEFLELKPSRDGRSRDGSCAEEPGKDYANSAFIYLLDSGELGAE